MSRIWRAIKPAAISNTTLGNLKRRPKCSSAYANSSSADAARIAVLVIRGLCRNAGRAARLKRPQGANSRGPPDAAPLWEDAEGGGENNSRPPQPARRLRQLDLAAAR